MHSNYTKIYTGTSLLAKRIVDALHQINIEAVTKDEGESARLAGFASSMLGTVELYVHNDELKEAQKLVMSMTSDS